MELKKVVNDISAALVVVDRSGVPFKRFQPGVGPYGEPQLLAAVAEHLNTLPAYSRTVRTKRTPDLLIPGQWALEVKLTRPFGDNGKQAENWSVNLLHPDEGNVSLIGDCLKLRELCGPERKGVVVIGYEHSPPQIALAPLLDAFELFVNEGSRRADWPSHPSRAVRLVSPRASAVTSCGVGGIVAQIDRWLVVMHVGDMLPTSAPPRPAGPAPAP
jgi:hypothetical protein